MSNRNRHFKGQMPDEVVIAFYRRHWVYLLPHIIPFFFFILFAIGLVVIFQQFGVPSIQEPFFQLLFVMAMVISSFFVHRFFLRLINFFLSAVIITNYRIIELNISLFLRNSKESIYMEKIQNVEKNQVGFFHIVLKFGQLNITLGNAEKKVLWHVPNPDYHFRLINRIKSGQYEKKGVKQEKHKSIRKDSEIPLQNVYVDKPFKV